MKQERAAGGSVGKPVENRACVAVMDADIDEILALDLGQELGDAVDERLAADEADTGVPRCLPGEMLATAVG